MFARRRAAHLSEHFLPLLARGGSFVHFTRVCVWSEETADFIARFYAESRAFGAAVDGRLPNPSGENLSYFNEILGADYKTDEDFLFDSLCRWLPRMNPTSRRDLAKSLFDVLSSLEKSGKPPAAVKNAYVKFMCWLYYRFSRVAENLGGENLPKIFLCGEISAHELMFVSALVCAGADALLVLPRGEKSYFSLDPASALSDSFDSDSKSTFPENFSVSILNDELLKKTQIERAAGGKSEWQPCTNAWADGSGFGDILKKSAERKIPAHLKGRFFANCYCRIDGADDRTVYETSLVSFKREILAQGRSVAVASRAIPAASVEEIAQIKRGRTDTAIHLACDLCASLPKIADAETNILLRSEFLKSVLRLSDSGISGGKLTSRAVSIACLLRRYIPHLFSNFRIEKSELPLFICFGAKISGAQADFVSLLSKLPCDVLVLNPQCLQNPFDDSNLFAVSGKEAVQIEQFPESSGIVRAGTAAYQAERDLDAILYSGTGIFREMQHSRLEAVRLMTTIDEIKILWNEESRFRPNFAENGDAVNVPVIFAKISGVKNGNIGEYWREVGKLCVGEKTFVVKNAPLVKSGDFNPMKEFAVDFFRGGVLRKERVLSHKSFPYSLLRKEIQELILEKLSILLEKRLVRGIGENGGEYTAIATILNMPKEIVHLFQSFDFAAKNPKFVYINSLEREISFEDAVLAEFLNLAGFDVVFFVPTGFRSVERYFQNGQIPEIIAGEFVNPISVPDEFPASEKKSFFSKILGKIGGV